MKTIFNDPINWAKKAVGTPTRFYVMVFLHVVPAVLLVAAVGFEAWVSTVILFGAWFPILYLYALKKTVEKLDKQD